MRTSEGAHTHQTTDWMEVTRAWMALGAIERVDWMRAGA
jgi:hypothetical protein